jgi:hypothetical protein
MIDGRGFPWVVICAFQAAGFCGRGTMPAAVALRPDWDAKRVRAAAREAKNADQARRLLSIAAAYEGRGRTASAKIGAMDRQTLCDWVRD